MISFLGLITFLLRLTLVMHGQVVAALPLDFSEKRCCLAQETPDSIIRSTVDLHFGNSSGLFESEEKEKSEAENKSLADLLLALHEPGIQRVKKEYYNPFFGNKALQGDQHLYDLFHSWKVDLG